MLEKPSKKTILWVALATFMVLALQPNQSAPAYSAASSGFDEFGVKEIYPSKQGGHEWYVNMDNPQNDPSFKNLENVRFTKNADGSWRVSANQIRMEAWSPPNEKWKNVEVTEYAKIVGGSNELLQIYSRGGHHTDKDQCLGSAYKARIYGNGETAWNKEITHPAYAGNRGEARVTQEPLKDRWIGFKAVIYNFIGDDGKTYVRLESYIDDDATDARGNLAISDNNSWKLASVYEDRGGWTTKDSDYNSSCGRDRDEILLGPGGTNTQNIAAFRSDDLTWDFKYLSVREIDPSSSFSPIPGNNNIEKSVLNNNSEPTEHSVENSSSTMSPIIDVTLVAGQHMVIDEANTTTIGSLELGLRQSEGSGEVQVKILQDNSVLAASNSISSGDIGEDRTVAFAKFDPPVTVSGSFDIVVLFSGTGSITGLKQTDYMNGNYFDGDGERGGYDLAMQVIR